MNISSLAHAVVGSAFS